MSTALDPAELGRIEAMVAATLARALDEIEAVVAVERVDHERPRWYVRLEGETKKHFSAELTLGQRTLVTESYFMPEPDENREAVYAQLLTRNQSMHDVHFAIGAENAIYLRGQLDNRHVDVEAIDRMLASVYDSSEAYFLHAMRLAFASRFTR